MLTSPIIDIETNEYPFDVTSTMPEQLPGSVGTNPIPLPAHPQKGKESENTKDVQKTDSEHGDVARSWC